MGPEARLVVVDRNKFLALARVQTPDRPSRNAREVLGSVKLRVELTLRVFQDRAGR